MENIIKEKWDEILSYMKSEYSITDLAFKTWILPLSVQNLDGNHLTIVVDDSKTGGAGIDVVKKKYEPYIEVSIAEVTGLECTFSYIPKSKMDKSINDKKKVNDQNIVLNEKYTFDTFVVGTNNSLAHAAAVAVAEDPAEIYNPLFIYGGVGLGKTHLMQSIAHYILDNDESNEPKKVIYVTGENFTNDLVQSIRNKTNDQFRKKYRSADILLIDDIQFISNKEGIQEEFFHTFNYLYESKKQIVISSDRPPKDMKNLEDRLRSRFEMGLIVDISVPNYETRLSILVEKNKDNIVSVDYSILEFIAESVTSNIRSLSGALDKVVALSKLKKKEITLDLAKEAIKDYIEPDTNKVLTLQYIVDIVAQHYELTSQEVFSKNRTSKIAYARHIAIYLCKKYLEMSLSDIGKSFNRDHSTISNSIERIETEIKTDSVLEDNINIIIKKINPS